MSNPNEVSPSSIGGIPSTVDVAVPVVKNSRAKIFEALEGIKERYEVKPTPAPAPPKNDAADYDTPNRHIPEDKHGNRPD
jgi:hypothetical protein